MECSYFLFPTQDIEVKLPRMHNCTWEFDNHSSLVEFGFEIESASLANRVSLDLVLYVPWLTDKCLLQDLYGKLKDTANSKFIFNSSVTNLQSMDGGPNLVGVIHQFSNRQALCLLPINLLRTGQRITISLDLAHYNALGNAKPNVYVRFSIKPNVPYISTRKNGIAKSSVIYDIKINERRNIPDTLVNELNNRRLCEIEDCFCFNILPNKYDIVFVDNSSLKNVRTLEYDSFMKYIDDKRLKKDELIVVFNKKNKIDPFSFFSMYSKEKIGVAQFSMALLLNVFCGILFFIASFRTSQKPVLNIPDAFQRSPIELYISLFVVLLTLIYFLRFYPIMAWRWIKIKFSK